MAIYKNINGTAELFGDVGGSTDTAPIVFDASKYFNFNASALPAARIYSSNIRASVSGGVTTLLMIFCFNENVRWSATTNSLFSRNVIADEKDKMLRPLYTSLMDITYRNADLNWERASALFQNSDGYQAGLLNYNQDDIIIAGTGSTITLIMYATFINRLYAEG